VERIGPKLASAIRDASQSDFAERVLRKCESEEVDILIPGDVGFPRLLQELADPPPILFKRGELNRVDQLSVAIVGTRHPTLYGRQVAESISRGLAKAGFTIVSGLARGIDAVAHRAAIDAGGRTIALLGSCVTDVYPPEHVGLANEITQHGAILSETDPFAKPKAGVFPQRNRLISGLSLGVIVVEAAERSGALITAQHAGEQGRDLFAIPGPINSRVSRGCNRLIRDGAILVQDAQDVIEHLGPLVEAADVADDRVIHHPAELQLNEQETAVLQAIQTVPTDLDAVVHHSQLPIARVLSTISVLEIRGLIRRAGGRSVMRI
jgi:DNA processing protein